jgi:dynein light chain 1, axonemal
LRCRHLALSTNNIEKISSLTGMENLKILSLGRNCIKKIENLDGIADTLEELWMSYNLVEKLVGIDKLANLRVLYLANNKVKDWAEIARLSSLDKLEDLLLKACPIYDDHKDAGTLSTYRVEVLPPCQRETSESAWKPTNVQGW